MIKFGYKKAQGIVVKLELLEDSIVRKSSRKYRTNKAKVVGFYDTSGNELKDKYEVSSDGDIYFLYKLNRISEVYDFNSSANVHWGNGIHFFETFEEAANYTSSVSYFTPLVF